MKKRVIIIIVIVIIFIVSYWIYQSFKPEQAEEPKDEIFNLLIELEQETEINFSKIKDVEFDWHTKKDYQIVQGKGFEATRISDEQFRSIGIFFTNKGFEADVYNIATEIISGMTGYKLSVSDTEQIVCHFIAGVSGYKEAEGQWIPPEPNLKDVEIKCGKTGVIDEFAERI